MYADVIPVQRMPRLSGVFTYRIPKSLQGRVLPGMLVLVPWRRSSTVAVVESVQETTAVPKTLEIADIVDERPMWDHARLRVLKEEAIAQCASLGSLCQAFIPDIPKRYRASQRPPSVAPVTDARLPKTVVHDLQTLASTAGPFLAIQARRMADRDFLYRQWCKRESKRILILVPQLIDALELQASLQASVNEPIAVWGEHISKNERWDLFSRIHQNEFRIIISTRSGVMLPIHDLGLIIIDQEDRHDHRSWESTPYFDSRDIARRLGAFAGVSVREVSLHPRIQRLHETAYLPAPASDMPIQTYFYRHGKELIHADLAETMAEAIEQQASVLIVCTKKAAHAGIICLDCQHAWMCRVCGQPLRHSDQMLICSTCAQAEPLPMACPRCGGSNLRGHTPGAEAVAKYVKTVLGLPVQYFTAADDPMSIKATPSVIISTPFTWRRLASLSRLPIRRVLLFHPESVLFHPDVRANEWYAQYVQWHKVMAHAYLRTSIDIQTGLSQDSSIQQTAVTGDFTGLAQAERQTRERLRMPPFGSHYLLRLKSGTSDDVQQLHARLQADFSGDRLYGPKPVPGTKEQQWLLILNADRKNLDKLNDSVYSKILVYYNPESAIFA